MRKKAFLRVLKKCIVVLSCLLFFSFPYKIQALTAKDCLDAYYKCYAKYSWYPYGIYYCANGYIFCIRYM